jgi:hypothetical protein
MTDKFIYFLTVKDGVGPVKIGVSSWPDSRLHDMMKWSPVPLRLLVAIPGDHQLERKIHSHFADDHSHLEWFFPSKKLFRFVNDLLAEKPITDLIDLEAPVVNVHQEYKKTRDPYRDEYRSLRGKLYWACYRAFSSPDVAMDDAEKASVSLVEKIIREWSYSGNYTDNRPSEPELEFAYAVIAALHQRGDERQEQTRSDADSDCVVHLRPKPKAA